MALDGVQAIPLDIYPIIDEVGRRRKRAKAGKAQKYPQRLGLQYARAFGRTQASCEQKARE